MYSIHLIHNAILRNYAADRYVWVLVLLANVSPILRKTNESHAVVCRFNVAHVFTFILRFILCIWLFCSFSSSSLLTIDFVIEAFICSPLSITSQRQQKSESWDHYADDYDIFLALFVFFPSQRDITMLIRILKWLRLQRHRWQRRASDANDFSFTARPAPAVEVSFQNLWWLSTNFCCSMNFVYDDAIQRPCY